MVTLTKADLILLGYGPSFSATIMRKAKMLMVEKGYIFYQTRKLNRVPVEAIEEILGISIDEHMLKQLHKTSCKKSV